jgi:hypothetical protein
MRVSMALFAVILSCGGSDDDLPSATDPYGPLAYIRGDVFTKLVLEVDSVPGFEPRNSVESALTAGLADILDKPGGIMAIRDGSLVSRGADHAWTIDELDDLADESATLTVDNAAAKMHILFVDGHYAEDTASSKILGVAWNRKNLVMFKQTLESVCASAPLIVRERVCAAAELGVWTHETGHLLGLVDNGLEMVSDHKDPDSSHGRHDASDDCIMFWAYNGGGIVDLFMDEEQDLGFDAACLADIAALRNRPSED